MAWLTEFPIGTARVLGVNLPIGGGGYFRLSPYELTRRGIRYVNTCDRQPVMFYIHPWEFDPGQPRLPMARHHQFRHYVGLEHEAGKLARLLAEFRFGTARRGARVSRTAAGFGRRRARARFGRRGLTGALSEITTLTDMQTDAWRRAVGGAAHAQLGHAAEWRSIINRAYGHAPLYLAATAGGNPVGVLPAFVVRRPLFGTVVTSMPFLDSGGPCSPTEALDGLLVELIALARQRRARLVGFPLQPPPGNRRAAARIQSQHDAAARAARRAVASVRQGRA